MKKIVYFISALSMITLAASCNKEGSEPFSSPREIVLSVDGGLLDIDVQTKATALSAVPSSLYWSATTGSAGSETSKWDCGPNASSVSGGKIATGKYQTSSATTYNYYVSNQKIAFAAAGSTIAADNGVDVIAGKASSSNVSPSVAMDHVFARTGSVSCSASNGYSLSNLSYKIKSKGNNTGTKGTYNIQKGTWSAATALAEQTFDSGSDLYLIPGQYTITVSGTESIGDYSKSFSASADIELLAGKINNISATRNSSGAQGISISVSLNPWGTNEIKHSI